MILTILVPTYNRAHFAAYQLSNLRALRQALAPLGIDVQVVVSDNHSTPAVTVPEDCKDFVELCKPEKFLNSGEENIIFAMNKCRGDYIWTLSDDDAPILHNVVELFRQILEKKPDFIVCGSSAYLDDGKIIHSQTVCSDSGQIKTLPDFVARTGLWFVMTGFSGLIVRRDMLQAKIAEFPKYFAASKIYSYAVFLLDVFWSREFMFFNRPVVLATQNDYGDSWDRMAAREGVFCRFFWTNGFIKQLQLLRAARGVPAGFYARVIDQGVVSRFPLLFQMGYLALVQLREDLDKKKSDSRAMSSAEFRETVDFLCAEEPRLMLIFAPLTKAQELADIPKKQIKKAIYLLEKITSRFFEPFYVKSFAGWNIYFFDDVYRAVPETHERYLMPELQDIAPVSSRWHIAAGTIEEMEQKLQPRAHQTFRSPNKMPAQYVTPRFDLLRRLKNYIERRIFLR